MAKIISITDKIEKKENIEPLEVIKEAMEIALQYFISENAHHKAAILTNTLNSWDEFFNKEGGNNDKGSNN